MKNWIQGTDMKIWRIIEQGPTAITKEVNGKTIPKTAEEWDDDDIKIAERNCRAKTFLFCAVNEEEYNKLSTCETAKEIWEKMELTYEGTSGVKKARIDKLMREYEDFKMKPNEPIEEALERVGKIIKAATALGRKLNIEDVNRKILR